MSQVCISYSSMKDAASEAGQVAKKLERYASNLDWQIYKKLDWYNGSYTNNIAQAKSNVNSKISDLRNRSTAYSTYSQDLYDLKDQCVSTDKAVKSNVSRLTASFKRANGIKNSVVQNSINYLLTSIGNKSSVGRWIGNKKDEADTAVQYLKESIKTWYNYDGGKELIKGVLIGTLEFAIGVLTVIGAILSGGAILVVIAGVVGGLIAAANGLANIWNEQKAYKATQSGDPATGRRRSKIDTWQDYLRSSFKYGDNGESYEYDKVNDLLATGIDIVNIACSIVTVFSSMKDLLKNGYKWATGNAAKLKDIKMRQLFSKDSFVSFKGKIKDIGVAFRYRGWSAGKDFGEQILKDFGRNFKKEFWNFKNVNGSNNWKGAINSMKNMLSIPKDILKGGGTLSNILNVGFNRIILPSTTAFTVNSTETTIIKGENGQFQFDFTDKITFKTIKNDVEGLWKLGTSTSGLFSDNSVLTNALINKLLTVSDVKISIPDVYTPNIDIPVLRSVA